MDSSTSGKRQHSSDVPQMSITAARSAVEWTEDGPRAGALGSCRFGSALAWHGQLFAGHGVTAPRCGASRRWDYASERSAVKSHIRIERGQSSRSFKVQLERRTVAFSVAVIKSLRTIPAGLESKNIREQVMRSATAIGANDREANRAESASDFVHKIAIAAKESAETEYWLLLLIQPQAASVRTYGQISSST